MSVNNNTVSAFREVIAMERDSLDAMLHRVDSESVESAVEVLLRCREKVVFIGVGKSGIIARKIAATFSSLGTRAIYMHASDALHGDIGMVSSKDVAVLISNSGTTEEILLLLPHLKLRKIPNIAIVGNLDSWLAKEADIILDSRVHREADDHNLAPTCSTTVQLAIGDALGVAVARLKGISTVDFAYNHPAGRLGKRLTLRVDDLMHKGNALPLLSPRSSFKEVIQSLAAYQAGAVCIVDDEQRLLGVVTDGDLKRCLSKYVSTAWDALTAFEMMSSDPVTTTTQALAVEAMHVMENRNSQISILPVVDEQSKQCVGIIRIHDIVKAGL